MVLAELGNHLETSKVGGQDTRTPNSKWTQNLDVEIKTVRESEETMRESLYRCRMGKSSTNDSKSRNQKEKIMIK